MARTRKKAPPRVDGPIRPAPPEPKRKVVERRELDGVIYQREWVTCGTLTCRCMKDPDCQGHGPYWYAYYLKRQGGGKARAGGRWVSAYVGREFAEI